MVAVACFLPGRAKDLSAPPPGIYNCILETNHVTRVCCVAATVTVIIIIISSSSSSSRIIIRTAVAVHIPLFNTARTVQIQIFVSVSYFSKQRKSMQVTVLCSRRTGVLPLKKQVLRMYNCRVPREMSRDKRGLSVGT